MATSSITKDFFVKDLLAFEKLKSNINQAILKKQVVVSPALNNGKMKLATFVFR